MSPDTAQCALGAESPQARATPSPGSWRGRGGAKAAESRPLCSCWEQPGARPGQATAQCQEHSPGNTARGSPARRRTERCAFQDWAASSPAVLGAPRPVARGGRGTQPHPAAPEAAASQSCLLLEQGGVPIPGDICSRHAAAPGVEQVGPATLLSDSRAPGDLRAARARWAAPRPPRRDSVA